uniref:Uncharacterized protein n=1 Tax=Romanomermis culicivorax TaxID=13658 RepID=A0A915J7J2_ROMCU
MKIMIAEEHIRSYSSVQPKILTASLILMAYTIMTDFADSTPPPALEPILLPSSSTIDPRNRTVRVSIHEYHENPPPLLKIEASTKNIWRPLAIDVGPINGHFASDSSSLIRKTDPDQCDNINSNALPDQLK